MSTQHPESRPILDVGAGTGRNALPLARRGHPVDAIEMTPKFAQIIRDEAQQEAVNVRVIERSMFAPSADLRQDYWLIIISAVVSDFRTTDELRVMFTLAAQSLAIGGHLVINAFLAKPGYALDDAARQLGQQCYTSIFTRTELGTAASGLPLSLVSDESVYEF
jgi:precorrin-6B methylase 2